MCALLYKSKVKTEGVTPIINIVLSKIIIFFISSGLLTRSVYSCSPQPRLQKFIFERQHRCYCLYGPCRFFYIISCVEFTVFQYSTVPNDLLFIGATFSTSKREWMLIGLFLISDWHSPSLCELTPSTVSTFNICKYAWREPRPLKPRLNGRRDLRSELSLSKV